MTEATYRPNHGEAFMIMHYTCEECDKVELLWNSRDGVTPFGIDSKCCEGKFSRHGERKNDERFFTFPTHVSRVFVDYDERTAREAAEKIYSAWLARGDFNHYPIPPDMGGVGGKEGFIIAKSQEIYADGHSPNVLSIEDYKKLYPSSSDDMMDTQQWAQEVLLNNNPDPATRPGEGMQAPQDMRGISLEMQTAHLQWMLNQISSMPVGPKSQRWTGFIQGIMWSRGNNSLEELADMNRAILEIRGVMPAETPTDRTPSDVPHPSTPSETQDLSSIEEAVGRLEKDRATDVYSHADCVFKYCPNPDTCKASPDGCLNLQQEN